MDWIDKQRQRVSCNSPSQFKKNNYKSALQEIVVHKQFKLYPINPCILMACSGWAFKQGLQNIEAAGLL